MRVSNPKILVLETPVPHNLQVYEVFKTVHFLLSFGSDFVAPVQIARTWRFGANTVHLVVGRNKPCQKKCLSPIEIWHVTKVFKNALVNQVLFVSDACTRRRMYNRPAAPRRSL